MTEAKHTPGPWLYHGHTIYFLDWDGRSYENGRQQLSNRWTCQMHGQTQVGGTGFSPRCTEEELSANVRLVAAAPDLLAELKELVETFRGYKGLEMQRARAAIAKASGQ